MMSELASNGGESVRVTVDGSPRDVSIQVVQGVFHHLTGKTEELTRYFDDPYQIEISSLEQLHHRVMQCLEQYQIKVTNVIIKTIFLDDTQESFSDFSRFSTFAGASLAVVESVLLVYDFLIVPPKLAEPQPYSIAVQIASKIAIAERMEKEFFEIPKIFRILNGRGAKVQIKYVDYSIARSLLSVFDGWFKALPQCDGSKAWRWIRKRSSTVNRVVAGSFFFMGLMIPTWSIFHWTPTLDLASTSARILVTSIVFMAAMWWTGAKLGKVVEYLLDSYIEMSWIKLTNGDRRRIVELEKRRSRRICGIIFAGMGTILLGVMSNAIYAELVRLMK